MGCIYKLIVKVLTARLAKVLGEVISECQHVFMEGRQIQYAILVANEVVDELVMNKIDGLICKLAMEKAYDHACWEFVNYMFGMMGFVNKWRVWMKVCLSTSSFAVLINGGASKFFAVSRDLKQGDPLSPFLFIVAMEALNELMYRARDLELIRGVTVRRGDNKMEISHLFFADDTLLFSQPEKRGSLYLKSLLLCFQDVSSLNINLQKFELVRVGSNSDGDSFARILE